MESNDLKWQKTISIRQEDVEKLLVAMQQVTKPFELDKRQRVIVDYDPEIPSIKMQYFTGIRKEKNRIMQ
mgnify:CR=1 FL=1